VRGDNLYQFKLKIRPEDYSEAGPVKIFTQEEIDEWTRTSYDEVWSKVEAQQGLTERDIKYLDGLKLMQAEQAFHEVMEGTNNNNNSEGADVT
jgi:hypothetical protein